MTSYAPNLDSALVRQFHVHVERRLAELTDADAGQQPIGYWFDPDVAEGRQEAVAVAAQVPAMLVLYSAAYFDDAGCGREWAVFAEREQHHFTFTRQRTSSAVCLGWKDLGPVPSVVSESASWHAKGGGLSQVRDVRDLVRLGGPKYTGLVDLVAQSLNRARRNAPRQLDLDLARLVKPAFGTGYGTGYDVITVVPTARTSDPRPDQYVTRPDRGETKLQFAFFVSHAAKAHDRELLARFQQDVTDALGVQVRRGVSSQGFFAPRDIPPGGNWPAVLCQAVCTTPVMVALLCDDFVESAWCGWEWAVFERRAAAAAESKPTTIFPLTWLEFDLDESLLPTPIRIIQRIPTTPTGADVVSEATCLVNLMEDEPDNYRKFVRQFARKIRQALQATAPTITEDEARQIPPAFGSFPPHDGPHVL